MKTVTGIVVVFSIILSADEASARYHGPQKVAMSRGAPHHFIYFNTEVVRHYQNEVIFSWSISRRRSRSRRATEFEDRQTGRKVGVATMRTMQ
jgi:hypothetical protein